MKNLLLLAFYFPPRGHIASFRSGCFAKFLPENGWLPTVVCENWPAGSRDFEPNLVGALPEEVEIHRIDQPPLAGFYERFVLRKLGPYLWPQRAPVRWWQEARARVLSLTREKHFDAVWATSDPMAPWALAAEVARAQGIPWVADLRDSFNEQPHGSWYKRPFFARQERRLAAQATRVVTVSQGMAGRLARKIGRPFDVIYNGFDPTLLPREAPERPTRFTLTYAGTLTLPRYNPAPILQAVEWCLQRKTIPADQIELRFCGSGGDVIEQAFPGAAQRLPLNVLPRLPHIEALRQLRNSSALLMLDDVSTPDVVPGKTGDYLASGRPILCFSNRQGELAEVLRRTGAGLTFTRAEDVAHQLEQWFAQWKSGEPSAGIRNEREIEHFSRRFGAKLLAGILDEITRTSPAGRAA